MRISDWSSDVCSSDLAHAQTVTIDAASSIRADATGSGDGGNVIIWSDGETRFAGAISARGAGAGRGGEAEVSSAGRLDYRGTADLTGSAFGTLLPDPYHITISGAADSQQSGFTATGAKPEEPRVGKGCVTTGRARRAP